MAFNNSVNANTPGIVGLNSSGVWTGTAVTQYNTLVGGASNDVLVNIAPSATAGHALVSNGSAANPSYSTTIIVAGGGTGLATLTAFELLAAGTTGTGNLQQVGIGTAGQVLYSNGAGALPSFGSPPIGVVWMDITSATQTIAGGHGYVTDNATQVTYTLPATPAFGDVFRITGGVSGSATAPWLIAQNAGQQINFGNSSTTVGTGGSIASTLQYDSIEAVCIVAGASAVWSVLDSVGNLTVV